MPLSQQQETKRGAPGLFTHPNRFSLPPGAVLEAQNCVVTREGIYTRRRGVNRYGTVLTGPASAIFEYDGTLVVFDSGTLKYDSDNAGTWTSYSGGFAAPAGAGMRALEAAENFYFTTSNGPYVLDSVTGTPVRSGIPQGLDIELALTGTGDSWFTADTQVGYRVTWKREDANGNEKQGAPSFQEVIANPLTAVTWTYPAPGAGEVEVTQVGHGYTSGDTVEISGGSDALVNGSYVVTVTTADVYHYTVTGTPAGSGTASAARNEDVSVTFTIPYDDIVAGDEWSLWRSELSADDDTSPSDNHRLVMSRKITAAEIASPTAVITVTDTSSYRDAENLYTNATSTNGGITQANDRPPLCQYMVEFEGHTFYGGETATEHEVEVRFIDVAGLIAGTSIVQIRVYYSEFTVAPRTFVFEAAENNASQEFKLWTTYSTLAENVAATMKSFVRVVNRQRSNGDVYAYYVSGEDDQPGKVLIRGRQHDIWRIEVWSSQAGTADNFDPVLPTTSGTFTVASAANEKSNVWYRSKFGQPEAVPRLNQERTGSANKASRGAVALNEAMMVYREDGIFTVSGVSDGGGGFDFVVDELDPTVRIKGPKTLCSLNNAAVAHTNQGVVRAAQGVPTILSRPGIEQQLIERSQHAQFADLAVSISYESERLLLLFIPFNGADNSNTNAYVYSYLTGAWTTWKKSVKCGIVLTRDDKLYLGHAVDNYILQERKSFTADRADFMDESIDVTVTAVSTTTDDDGDTVSLVTLTYDYTEALVEGFRFTQSTHSAPVTAVTDNGSDSYTVQLRYNLTTLVEGAATVSLPIVVKLEWLMDGGSPATTSEFTYVQFYLEQPGGTHKIGFQSDRQSSRTTLANHFVSNSGGGWGESPWGQFPWGNSPGRSGDVIRAQVPTQHVNARALRVRYENHYAKEQVNILSVAVDERQISTATERTPT